MVQKIIASKVNFLARFSSVDMVMMMIVSSNTFKISIVIVLTLQIDLKPLYLVVLLLRQQLVVCQYQVGLDSRYAGVQ